MHNPFFYVSWCRRIVRTLSKLQQMPDVVIIRICVFQLYDSGYRNIWNIDTDEGVIKKQIEDNCPGRKGLEFLCASAQQVFFSR